MKKIIRNIIAVFLITFGVIGSLIPILQGWVFVLTGFIIIDFKGKDKYEEKIIKIISKTKIGRRLADLWIYAKNINKKVLEKDHEEKIRKVYKDIDKKIIRKEWDKK